MDAIDEVFAARIGDVSGVANWQPTCARSGSCNRASTSVWVQPHGMVGISRAFGRRSTSCVCAPMSARSMTLLADWWQEFSMADDSARQDLIERVPGTAKTPTCFQACSAHHALKELMLRAHRAPWPRAAPRLMVLRNRVHAQAPPSPSSGRGAAGARHLVACRPAARIRRTPCDAVRAYIGLVPTWATRQTLRQALDGCSAVPRWSLVAVSRCTAAHRRCMGPDFTNAVAAVDTTLSAPALLALLLALEARAGRTPHRNAPRTL